MLSIAVTRGQPLKQLDIENAFLHGSIIVNVYMQQPQDFVDPTHLNYICKLHRAIMVSNKCQGPSLLSSLLGYFIMLLQFHKQIPFCLFLIMLLLTYIQMKLSSQSLTLRLLTLSLVIWGMLFQSRILVSFLIFLVLRQIILQLA